MTPPDVPVLEPDPPAPGEPVPERWWQRSAVKAAAFQTVLQLVAVLRRLRAIAHGDISLDPADVWLDYAEQEIGLWGIAFGVTAGPASLRKAAVFFILGWSIVETLVR